MSEQISRISKPEEIVFTRIEQEEQFPEWATRSTVEEFLFTKMQPFNDPPGDITSALDYVFGRSGKPGGFITLAQVESKLVGVCVMMRTGMGGYIPEWILLYIGVDPEMRGLGIGGKLMKQAIDACDGDVKLHVEYDNPAKRLYERFGFTSKYAEMRYSK